MVFGECWWLVEVVGHSSLVLYGWILVDVSCWLIAGWLLVSVCGWLLVLDGRGQLVVGF